MRILFLGQRGIPALPIGSERERRVDALAGLLAVDGHEVTVTCSSPYTARSIRRYNGIMLKHVFSIHPDVPGGWVHAILEALFLWRGRYDIVHLHGWRLGVLAPLMVLLDPEATFVWTIDSVPALQSRSGRGRSRLLTLVAQRAGRACDAVTVTARTVQYQLLQEFNVRAHYVPDGYATWPLPDIPARAFGLRRGHYYATTANSRRQVRFTARAFEKVKTRKRLVVFQEPRGAFRQLAREFSCLHFVGTHAGRARLSLLRQAAALILVDRHTATEEVLHCMAAGKAMVSVMEPRFEELLGVSARFVRDGDTAGLTEALTEVTGLRPAVRTAAVKWGASAQRRARSHYRWERIVREYVELYRAPTVKAAGFDSVRHAFARLKTAQ